jgi:hypothetical protein
MDTNVPSKISALGDINRSCILNVSSTDVKIHEDSEQEEVLFLFGELSKKYK